MNWYPPEYCSYCWHHTLDWSLGGPPIPIVGVVNKAQHHIGGFCSSELLLLFSLLLLSQSLILSCCALLIFRADISPPAPRWRPLCSAALSAILPPLLCEHKLTSLGEPALRRRCDVAYCFHRYTHQMDEEDSESEDDAPPSFPPRDTGKPVTLNRRWCAPCLRRFTHFFVERNQRASRRLCVISRVDACQECRSVSTPCYFVSFSVPS